MGEKLDALVIGDNHYNTLNVIRALGQDGIQVYAIVKCESSKSFVLKSRYIHKGYRTNHLDISSIIKEFAKSDHKIPIIATSDSIASFLDKNYTILSQYFILPSVRKQEGALTFEMDKEQQIKNASEVGFNVPFSISVDFNQSTETKIKKLKYPCLIKPIKSLNGSKNDFRICHNKAELLTELELLSGHLANVIVQEYIPNEEVILVAGVRTLDGENFVTGEINKTKHSERLNNLGLNCFGFLSLESKLTKLCKRYVDKIDYHGCYSIELIRAQKDSDNLDYFVEINLRTDGLLYFYTCAGINYPSIWIKSCYDLTQEIKNPKPIVYGMNEFLYIKNSLSWSSIKDLFKTDIFSTMSFKDPIPFIAKILYHE